nr:unnamed protein product [Callosobruchus chinensis]
MPHIHCTGQVVYAVNCGADAHTDSYGIRYERDPLNGKVGIASDYGKRLLIGRVPPNDYILYQTESLFQCPDQKVFDVVLNGEHTIVSDLDIFEKVGRGVAHDEYIPFKISKGRLYVNSEDSEIHGNKIRVEFIKTYKDNPKINAMYVMKGTLDDVPKLPPIPSEPVTPEPLREEVVEPPPSKIRKPSGPKQPDPYSEDESSLMLPIFIAIGAFIPVLFCLCKL